MKHIIINQTASSSMKRVLFSLTIFLSFCRAQAQIEYTLDTLLAPYVTETSTDEWMEFNDRTNTNGRNLFTQLRGVFRLRGQDEMRLVNTTEDTLGYTHFRYQQYYKDLRIEGAEFWVHDMNGRAESANGIRAWGADMDAAARISSRTAIQTALAYVGAEVYMWEDTASEAHLKELEEDPNATHYPSPELLFASMEDNRRYATDAYKLAYQVDVHALEPLKSVAVFVDALDGSILKETAISHECNVGTGKTTWHGNRTIRTDKIGYLNLYYLKDDCQAATIRTRYKDANNNVSNYFDTDNQWFSSEDQAGVTTHWGTKMAYNYFLYAHNRVSWNGLGGNINAYNKPGINNAYWSNGTMTFGLGSSDAHGNDWNTLDIVGHEFSHGVVQTTAGLIYQGESGALNESFADIFGTMVERYVEGDANYDWKMGEDRGNHIRNLSDPHAHNDPHTYKGTYWYTGSGDNGGVHTNSGVQNYWFYLLSEGGSGTNDKGDSYQVSGIGEVKARKIAYRSLAYYLTSNSKYIDARKGSIKAAKDLYGACSFEAQQVSKAWYAVGVGKTAALNPRICGNILPFWGTKVYTGVYTLTSGGNGCSTNIMASSYSTIFRAGQNITLKPGFKTLPNAKFRAYTSGCALTAARMAPEHDPFHIETASQSEQEEVLEISSPNIGMSQLSLRAYPNPFSTETTLEYELPENGVVNLIIRDIVGKVVAQPVMSTQQYAGKHYLTFNASNLSAGVYMAIIQHNGKQVVQRLSVK